MGSVRWRTAIGRPLFFFSQEITIHLIKKDKGVMEDKKLTMPMIALRGLTVLPQMTVNFDIIRDKSIAAVEQAMVGDQRVFLATQKQPDEVIPDIDGIFAADMVAIACIRQLLKRKKKVQRDVKVVAYDGTYVAKVGVMNLTVVQQPIEELAKSAVNILLNMMQGKKYHNKKAFFEPSLLYGDTTYNKDKIEFEN